MVKAIKNRNNVLPKLLGSHLFSSSYDERVRGVLFVLLLLLTAYHSKAQSVPIPNPNWPLDSVINRSVHQYTVQGDRNYTEPSNFVWFVEGGRFFYDSGLTALAGDGTTATVTGDANNVTSLWVVWDSFDQPLDTGYVYLYEISSKGCERDNLDEGKYQGLRIKVSAPPKVRFITQETITCSYDQSVLVDVEIDGMPPFDLKYSINGVVFDRHVEPSDLIDSDEDGNVNNITILVDGYFGTTVDLPFQLELLEASSGGVLGKILEYPTHTVYAFAQPDAPIIHPTFTEITSGETHQMLLYDAGQNVAEWIWEIHDLSGTMVYQTASATISEPYITFGITAGEYYLVSYYKSISSCFSFADSIPITIFQSPEIAFADTSKSAIGCSAVTSDPDDSFEFTVEYSGALYYDFKYAVYDYNNVLLGEYPMEYQTERTTTITIPNTFINDELPQINRTWKVVITNGVNVEGVNVKVLDSDIAGGRDERTITIHPKPIITDDIDFAN